jgi:multimeric flavodoxin WrbA
MKKLLIINGSYREAGDTAFLIDNVIKGFRESAPEADIEMVPLKDIRMEYCRGCWTCANPENSKKPIGACPIEDDVRPLLEKSLACDALVYATPVYEMGPSAVMKKFLERNLPVVGGIKFGFYGRSARRKGKSGAVMLSSGAPHPFNRLMGFTTYPRKLLSLFCRFHACDKIFVLPAGGVGGSEKMRRAWGRKAFLLGKKMARLSHSSDTLCLP